MALFSQTITGLINGVSRQPYALRLQSQGYEQVNCISSLSKGVQRRAGAKVKQNATMPATPQRFDAWHWIDRDATHRYLVWVDKQSASDPDVRIVDLINGTVITPTYTAGRSYLRCSGNPSESLRFLTVGDRTYIANVEKTPAMSSTPSANPDPWAFVWVKAAIPSIPYTVNLKPSGGSATAFSITADATPTTAEIASSLASSIDADANFVAEAVGSLVIIRHATSATEFDVSVSDGWADQGMIAVKNKSKVQSFAALPPVGVDGMIVEVEGDPETSIDSYFVKFVASGAAKATTGSYASSARNTGVGVWEETVKWNTKTALDVTTMPVTLTGTSAHAFTLNTVTWGSRTVGDETSAPDPAFVGQPIQDLAFFKNRMAVVTGESVAFSGVGDYESFFPTTVTTLTDDDAFDVTANFPEVAKLRFAIPFNDALVLFSDAGIFGTVGSVDGFTPKTVQFLRLASFTGKVSTRPVMAGDRIFFTEERDNETVLREFFQVDREGVYVVEPVSEHVDDYIPPNALRVVADGVNNIVAVLSGEYDLPQAWIYQYFHSNREKVQSAWHRWTFSGYQDQGRSKWGQIPDVNVYSAAFIGGKFYAAACFNASPSTALKVLEIPLSPEPDPLLGTGTASDVVKTDTNHLVPYFDYWQQATSLTPGVSTSTMLVSGRLDEIHGGDLANIIVVPYDASTATVSMGTPLTVTACTSIGDVTTITVSGVHASPKQFLVGVRMRSTYEFTPPAIKNQGNVPVLGGRTTLKRARVRFESPVTVYGHLVILPKSDSNLLTTTRRQLFTQRREIEFPVHRVVDPTLVVGVHSEQPLQDFALFAVTWEFDQTSRHGARNA